MQLQEADDLLKSTLSRPKAARFVEKAGVTTVTDIGRPNPWVAEVWCNRKDCLFCKRRLIIAEEKEKEALAKVWGKVEEGKVTISKAIKVAFCGCTREGVLYVLVCQTCQKNGIKRHI